MFEVLFETLSFIRSVIDSYWWVGALIVLFLIAKRLWVNFTKNFHDYWEDRFLESVDKLCLEVIIPTDLEKTPQAMEQVYAALYATKRGVTTWDEKFRGHLETSYSFELISQGGDTHFVIHAPVEHRETLESHLYSQFPEIEINEVEDYTEDAPDVLPNEEFGCAAAELKLRDNDAYPIRTYKQFDLESGRQAEEAVDPMAPILETFNAVRPKGNLWLQVLFSPPMPGADWRSVGRKLVDQLMERDTGPSSKGFFSILFSELVGFLDAALKEVTRLLTGDAVGLPRDKSTENQEEDTAPIAWRLTEEEKEKIKAIERNISKSGFYTTIRAVYFAPWEVFTTDKVVSLVGAFEQFNDENLNGFEVNSALGYKVRGNHFRDYRSKIYYLAWKYREIPRTPEQLRELRMREIYKSYKQRSFGKHARGHKGFFFNSEELATVYHFPMKSVETPELPKVGAKKGEPPAGLPIEE